MYIQLALLLFAGLPVGGLPFYDPSLHGTPVTMLQIPPTVMQTITAKLQSGSHVQCKFTQDGKNMSDLTNVLHEKDKKCLHLSDVEVCIQYCTYSSICVLKTLHV